jgi:glycosyltransferase involved in cell wall biosynthesis
MTGDPSSVEFEPLARGTSIIIPAWNDGERLQPTLEYLIAGLDAANAKYEIVVVADGCKDGTPELVRSYGTPNVRVLEFPSRLGKGGAIVEGLMRARYDNAGFLDADSPLPVSDLLNLVGHLAGVEGVIASRWPPGQSPKFHDSARRNMLSIGWSVLSRGLLLTRCRDTQCGAKFFRTKDLKTVLRQVAVQGWAFDLALLYHWEKTGLGCLEVSTTWKDRPGSKLDIGRALPLMLFSLIGLRLINSPVGRWTPETVRHGLRVKLGRLARGLMTSSQPAESPFPP